MPLLIQIVLGILLIATPWLLRRSGTQRSESRASPSTSPGAMFLIGATLILLGIPGAVPYLAAIERITQQDPHWSQAIGYLAFYNLSFVLPFLCLIALRYFLPGHAGAVFRRVSDFSLSIMPKLTALVFVVAGLVLVADGLGWFLSHPLLPVSADWESSRVERATPLTYCKPAASPTHC